MKKIFRFDEFYQLKKKETNSENKTEIPEVDKKKNYILFNAKIGNFFWNDVVKFYYVITNKIHFIELFPIELLLLILFL